MTVAVIDDSNRLGDDGKNCGGNFLPSSFPTGVPRELVVSPSVMNCLTKKRYCTVLYPNRSTHGRYCMIYYVITVLALGCPTPRNGVGHNRGTHGNK